MADLFSVSEIRIHPVKTRKSLVAFASCVLNKSFYLGNLAIHKKTDGSIRIVYPTKRLPNGAELECFYPITKEAGRILLAAIANYYTFILSRMNGDGYFGGSSDEVPHAN